MYYAVYSDCCDEVRHSTIVKFATREEAEAHLDEVDHEFMRFGRAFDAQELADWISSEPH